MGVNNETGSLVWKQVPALNHSCRTLSQTTGWALSHHSAPTSMGSFVSVPPKFKKVAVQVSKEIDLVGDQGLI